MAQDAIEALYRVFARYPRPRELWAAPYREAGSILRDLAATPLRSLSGEALGAYPAWAMTTVGTADDYRHFLPRILELAIIGQNQPHDGDPQIIASKLDNAGWRAWPENEQVSIEMAFREGFIRSFRAGGEWAASDWLDGLALADVPLAPSLEAVSQLSDDQAAPALAELVIEWQEALSGERPQVPAWWDRVKPETAEEVLRWLRSPAVARPLATDIAPVEGNTSRERIARARDVLRSGYPLSHEVGDG